MLNINLVVIELGTEENGRKYNTHEELTIFLNKMNIQHPDINDRNAFNEWEYWDKNYSFAEKLRVMSLGITGSHWIKVWINPENGYLIAYEDLEGKKFSKYFIEYMENIGTLDTGDLPCNLGKTIINTNLSLDTILEKIFTQGLGELTMEEVNFLGDISKDL